MAGQETVLVTGGAGYIGSHAAYALMAEGYRVVVLDNLSTGTRWLVPRGADFVQGDVADKALVITTMREHGIKTVLHFAAFVDVAESVAAPEKYRENNYQKTALLIGAAKAAGARRFIFSSTAAVYGNPDTTPVLETADTRPISPYGESKLLAEKLVERSGLRYAILRYFNVAGAHWSRRLGYATEGKIPTHLIRRVVLAMSGDIDHIDIFGTDYPTHDGSAVRDYIHVRDLVQAHADVLRYLEQDGESGIFNVGYGEGHSVIDVILAAQKILGRAIETRNCPRRAGDPGTVVADSRKLRERVTWEPQFQSLGGMIRDEYDWVMWRIPPV